MLDFNVFEELVPDEKERRRVRSKKKLTIQLLPWGSVCYWSFFRWRQGCAPYDIDRA